MGRGRMQNYVPQLWNERQSLLAGVSPQIYGGSERKRDQILPELIILLNPAALLSVQILMATAICQIANFEQMWIFGGVVLI